VWIMSCSTEISDEKREEMRGWVANVEKIDAAWT